MRRPAKGTPSTLLVFWVFYYIPFHRALLEDGENYELESTEAPGEVCGGTEYMQIMTDPRTLASIANVPWATLEALAVKFIEKKKTAIKTTDKELAAGNAKLPHDKAKACVPLSTTDMENFIQEAIKVGYGNLAEAAKNSCQMPEDKSKSKAMWGAFNKAVTKRMGKECLQVETESALKVCEALLGSQGKTPFECTSLCASFVRTAGDISQKLHGGVGADEDPEVADAKNSMKALETRRKTDYFEAQECLKTHKFIEGFKKGIQDMNAYFKAQTKAIQDTHTGVTQVKQEINGALKSVQEQQILAKGLQNILLDDTKNHKRSNAAKQFNPLKKRHEELLSDLNVAIRVFTTAQEYLDKTALVVAGALEMQSAVAALDMQMVLLFDRSVRQPLKEMGIRPDESVEELLPDDEDEDSTKSVKRTLNQLKDLCSSKEGKALKNAFASGNNYAALCPSSLDVDSISDSVHDVVEDKVKAARSQLQSVRRWVSSSPEPEHQMLAFDDDDDTDEEGVETDLSGDPFEEMKLVYRHTHLFKKFLKRFRKGGSLEYKSSSHVEKLGKIVVVLSKTQENCVKATENLRNRKTSFETSHRAALDAAKDVLSNPDDDKTMKTLDGKQADMIKLLDSLESKLEKVSAKYKASVNAILNAKSTESKKDSTMDKLAKDMKSFDAAESETAKGDAGVASFDAAPESESAGGEKGAVRSFDAPLDSSDDDKGTELNAGGGKSAQRSLAAADGSASDGATGSEGAAEDKKAAAGSASDGATGSEGGPDMKAAGSASDGATGSDGSATGSEGEADAKGGTKKKSSSLLQVTEDVLRAGAAERPHNGELQRVGIRRMAEERARSEDAADLSV